jgi:aspartate aminotransferase
MSTPSPSRQARPPAGAVAQEGRKSTGAQHASVSHATVGLPRLSRRGESLGTENAFVVLAEVNALLRAGRDIVSFCIGQPDFPTPTHVQDAAIAAIRAGKHGYTPSAGIDELRAAAARDMGTRRGLDIRADDVVVAAGAKPFIAYTIASVTDYGVGDEVIYPVPGFPIYESQILANGAVPVPVFLRESRDFAFDPAELEAKITPKTRLLILNTPQNPTGGVLHGEDLDAIAAILLRHPHVWVFADEIYSRLVYDGRFDSLATRPGMLERTVISDGASKTWAMTGWRIGYVANRALAPVLTRWITNTESCASHITQWAAVQAIEGPQDAADAMRASFLERRDLIVRLLNSLPGVTCRAPGGAFYAWPNVTEVCRMTGCADSEALRKRLLNDAGVAVLADIHFGRRVPGDGQHIRFSYAASNEAIEEGIRRFADFIRRNRR